MNKITPFYLKRLEDESGVSGTGVPAVGYEFNEGGPCVLGWYTAGGSAAVYRNLQDVETIHGHGGKTQIISVRSYDIQEFGVFSELPNNFFVHHDFGTGFTVIFTGVGQLATYCGLTGLTLSKEERLSVDEIIKEEGTQQV